MRFAGQAVLALIDWGLSRAIQIDKWLTERRQREPKGLTYKDVERINRIANEAGHEKSRAPTRIVRRE